MKVEILKELLSIYTLNILLSVASVWRDNLVKYERREFSSFRSFKFFLTQKYNTQQL